MNFPPPPRLTRDSSSPFIGVSSVYYSKDSVKSKFLTPIGIFWDIENCQVPKTKSASLIIQRIRELFYDEYREAEFLIVCDVKKESPQVIQDLNDAQINLIHVSSKSKNAADEKLRQLVRRFAEIYEAPSTVALISSDINFAADLSDLRYRKKIQIILIHNNNVADALILCANKTYNFRNIIEKVPAITPNKLCNDGQETDLHILNLPVSRVKSNQLKIRLKILTDNCGGRVLDVNRELGVGLVRFSSLDYAIRAQKRLDGEDVYGNKIVVSKPSTTRESPFKHYSGHRIRNLDISFQPLVTPPLSGSINSSYNFNNSAIRNPWTGESDQNNSLQTSNLQSVFRPIRTVGYTNTGTSINNTSGSSASAHNNYCDYNLEPRTSQNLSKASLNSNPIELVISNLDGSVESKDLRNVLIKMLKQYAMILNLTISTQTDGSPIATVKVGSQQEAQYVISQLHHQWLGSKRVTISYAQSNSDPDQLRFMIITLLQKVPDNSMPLFKFFELVESRYHCTISLSEVNKLKDICKITEGQGGRMITLTSEASLSSPIQMNNSVVMYCTAHCPNGLESGGWGEAECISLPNIRISLKVFWSKVNHLLITHMGWLPLLSFPICYAHEFNQPLPIDEGGVPLEHLITCSGTVELSYSALNKNLKYLKMKDAKENGSEPEDHIAKSVSPSLMGNITMLCREVVDLLKTADRCQLLMSRFIPAYHHHFGRQCRVADYGFTRLADLFEAISHVVQILGTGTKRTITLTHSAQVRRFTSDLLRVLKISKQITLVDFPNAYKKVMHRPFNPVEYGLCSLEDLLDEVPENTVVIATSNNSVTLAIPKREQTINEIQKTQQFALEVVELLKHAPYCSMLFNKFVPAYHHHFGRQCKVSDYGFSKLAELFEAIPDTVELEGSFDVDRKVKLKLPLALKVLGSQIRMLIKESKLSILNIDLLPTIYKQTFGTTLNSRYYSSNNLEELIAKLGDYVQVIYSSLGLLLASTEVDTRTLEIRVWALLLFPPHSLKLARLLHEYKAKFYTAISPNNFQQIQNVVSVSNNGGETMVSLTKFYTVAAQFYHILYSNNGYMEMENILHVYARKYRKSLCPQDFQVNSLQDLLRKMNFLLNIQSQGGKDILLLSNELAVYGVNLPIPTSNEIPKQQELSVWPPPSNVNFEKIFRRVTPPKPDTPPPDNGWHTNLWCTPTKGDVNLNLSIPILPVDASKVFLATEDLVSPTRITSLSYSHPINIFPRILAPHPTVVPLPDKLISKNESSDSGVNTTRIEYNLSESEMDSLEGGHLNGVSSKVDDVTTFSSFNM